MDWVTGLVALVGVIVGAASTMLNDALRWRREQKARSEQWRREVEEPVFAEAGGAIDEVMAWATRRDSTAYPYLPLMALQRHILRLGCGDQMRQYREMRKCAAELDTALRSGLLKDDCPVRKLARLLMALAVGLENEKRKRAGLEAVAFDAGSVEA